MNSFAVVTDSAADIPLDLAREFDIKIVPLHVAFQGREYNDGVDISTPELLRLMQGSDELPSTSQPSPADFLTVYKELFEAGYTQILSIHLARALSATIESARAIAGQVPEGLRLEVVDSRFATVGQGAMVLEAAVIAKNGGTLDEALERIEAIRAAARIHFLPDTLDNLVKGGRATKAQGFVTSLLDIKLVIGLEQDGSIVVERKAKGAKAAIVDMRKRMAAAVKEFGPQVYYILHTNAPERVAKLTEEIQKLGGEVRYLTDATIGPVIATHVGEGAIGVFYYPANLHAAELDGVSKYLTPVF